MAQNFSDEMWNGASDAIADVRSKYEEVMWGRTVTERGGEAPAWPQAQEPEPAFGSITRNIESRDDRLWSEPQTQQTVEKEREQDRDIDLDR